jgi:histidine triad (HIT) family protein
MDILPYMEETIFSKIIRGEVPAVKIYEDDDTFAFLDHMPNAPGHTLVLPKKHVRNIFDVNEELFAKTMETVRMLAPKIRDAVQADGMRICIDNEPAGGQVVFHLHVHLIPFFGESPAHFSHRERVSNEELLDVAKKIHNKLS